MPRNRIDERNEVIFKKFNTLYNGKRIRIDDAISKVADEFFLKPDTVLKIIKKRQREDENSSIDLKGI